MGELARQPDAPKLSEDALELLTVRKGQGYSVVQNYKHQVSGTILGFVAPIITNRGRGRPWFAGIHHHFIGAVVGYFIGHYTWRFRVQLHNENDAILKHYISLHPEDFPPFERKRFKDLFLPWDPVR